MKRTTLPRNLIVAIVDFIHHHLIWVILSSYLIAGILPALGLWIRDVHLADLQVLEWKVTINLPSLLMAALLFNAGLGVDADELRILAKTPKLLIAGALANIAMPLLFIVTVSLSMRFWHNSEEVQQILVGLALVASMPIAGASTAWSQNANGNLALSLGLVLLTTLFSPLLTPLVMHGIGFITVGDYSEDLHELASNGVVSFLGVWVILPSLLGMLANQAIGHKKLAACKPYLKLANYSVLILLNYSNASLTLPKVIAQPDLDFLAVIAVIVTLLCIIAFSSGYWLGRIFKAGRRATISLMFGLGMSNNGTGLVLASMSLSDHPEVMLPIIFYNLIQHLVAASVDGRISRQKPQEL